MHRTLQTLDRARSWVVDDRRVRAALVHGSVVGGRVTALSDLDLIVIAEPGERDSIWSDRETITTRLLGAPIAVGAVLPHRPYRWQARTAELDMLDFTIDEGYMAMWDGFEGPVEFLIDRADVATRFEVDMTAQNPEPPHDAAGDCDATWGGLAKLTALLLHGRRQVVRAGLNDLIADNLVPLLDREDFLIGHIEDDLDERLLAELDRVYPTNSSIDELTRSLSATAAWYTELLTAWGHRTGKTRPASNLEPGVPAALQQLRAPTEDQGQPSSAAAIRRPGQP